MNPCVMIGDALHFGCVENREHFEMPLPKEVDPVWEEVLTVRSVDNGLKTFLEDEIRRIEN